MPRASIAASCTAGACVIIPLASWHLNQIYADPSRCRLHYSAFHGIFILPPLLLLYFLARPFLTQLDHAKLALLPIIAFVWTTPWDNVLVRNHAWSYPPACVLARIGYVPVEEYAFFILQSLLTTLFTILMTRWETPSSSSRSPSSLSGWLAPTSALICVGLGLYGMFNGSRSVYYLSMISWWASTPLVLLLWGTRRSWPITILNGQSRPWVMSILVPTLYLCCADLYAMRRGTWHISESTSLQLFVLPDLPIEEGLFFLMTNTILVCACFTFDRVVWQLRTLGSSSSSTAASRLLSPTSFALDWRSVKMIWSAFLRLDQYSSVRDSSSQLDQHRSLRILARASRSFHLASLLLPWDLRVDLGCLYAFARAMDDVVDQPGAIDEDVANARIGMLQQLINASFGVSPSTSSEDVHRRINAILSQEGSRTGPDTKIHISQPALDDLGASARAASALRLLVPQHLWDELLDGYRLDSHSFGPHFERTEQLMDYAQNVAGCVGEMCVRVVLGRAGCVVDPTYRVVRDRDVSSLDSGSGEPLTPPRLRLEVNAPHIESETIALILRDARRMGCGLQLVNIARDIVKDARELGRCYLVLPAQMDGREEGGALRERLRSLRSTSDPEKSCEPLSSQLLSTIHAHQLSLLDTADALLAHSAPSIALLPSRPARTGLRAACTVYASIATTLREGGVGRADDGKVGRWRKVRAALRAVYVANWTL